MFTFPTSSHFLLLVYIKRICELWIYGLGHWPNVPKFKMLSADQNDQPIVHSKSMEWRSMIIATLLMTGIDHSNVDFEVLRIRDVHSRRNHFVWCVPACQSPDLFLKLRVHLRAYPHWCCNWSKRKVFRESWLLFKKFLGWFGISHHASLSLQR